MSSGVAAVYGLREPRGRARAVVVKDRALGTLASFNHTGLMIRDATCRGRSIGRRSHDQRTRKRAACGLAARAELT